MESTSQFIPKRVDIPTASSWPCLVANRRRRRLFSSPLIELVAGKDVLPRVAERALLQRRRAVEARRDPHAVVAVGFGPGALLCRGLVRLVLGALDVAVALLHAD